jgi:uncharacterized protein
VKLHLNNPDQINLIQSCDRSEQRFQLKIGGNLYNSSLILTPENLEMWAVNEVSEVSINDFQRLAEIDAEVIILGTGPTLVFPPQSLTLPLINKGIGLEVMDTPAACRTYNILAADGRKPLAGLIL